MNPDGEEERERSHHLGGHRSREKVRINVTSTRVDAQSRETPCQMRAESRGEDKGEISREGDRRGVLISLIITHRVEATRE